MAAMTPHELRERIEQILLQPASVSATELQESAETYARVIRDLNHRLSICNQWLDAGLRSEAIHMATLKPDLLDALSQLDLGDSLQDWVDLCTANNATVPPRANWELASYLNDAWDKETELTDQLRQLRLAMLTHRDISTRLDCLRTLLHANPDNSSWDVMVRQHERLRLHELRSQLHAASAGKHLKQVTELTNELRSAVWLEPPPADLLAECETVNKRVRAHRVAKEFEKLAGRLHEAMAAADEAKAIQWRRRWNDAKKLSGLKPSANIALTAESVFGWLDSLEQQRAAAKDHDLACRKLAMAIDDQTPSVELEPMHFHIQQMDVGVPELLEQRYQDRLRSEAQQKRTRLALRIGLAVAVLALLATGAVYAVNWYGAASRTKAYAAQLQSAILEENVPLMTALLDRGTREFPDAINGDLIKQRDQARSLIEVWTAEREQCKKTLSQLASLPDAGTITSSEMNQLKAICKTKDEKRLFEELNERREESQAVISADARQTFQEAFTKVQVAFQRMKVARDVTPVKELIAECESLLIQLRNIQATLVNERISAVEVNNATQLQKSINDFLDQLQQDQSRITARDDLLTRLSQPGLPLSAVIDTLQTLDDNYSDFEYHTDISRTLETTDIVQSIAAWADVKEQLPPVLLDLHGHPSKARDIAEALTGVHASPIIGQDEIDALDGYLGSIEAMQDPKHHPETTLASFIDASQPWTKSNLRRLVTQNGVFFADKNELKEYKNPNFWILKGVVSTNDDIQNGSREAYVRIVDGDRPRNVKPSEFQLQPTGMQQWLKTVDGTLLQRPRQYPGTWYLDLLAELTKISDMEPNVQLALSSQLAHLHQTYSWPRLGGLTEAAAHSTVMPPDDWANPRSGEDRRREARTVLGGLPPETVEAMRDTVLDAVQTMQQSLPPLYEHAGIVWFDEDGHKKMIFDDSILAPNRTYDVFALVDTGSKFEWTRVATRRGAFTSNDRITHVLLGMPLFVTEAMKE